MLLQVFCTNICFFFSLKYIELAKYIIYILLLNVLAGVLYQHLFFFSLKYIELAKCMIYILLLNVVAGILYQHLFCFSL